MIDKKMPASAAIEDADIVDANVRLSDAVFAWCSRQARCLASVSKREQAVQWSIIAGEIAEKFCISTLANESLEATLRGLGAELTRTNLQTPSQQQPLRWLHVLSRCYESGGHTALCRRWMELDPSDDIHSVALTFQGDLIVPDAFRDAVANRSGDFQLLDVSTTYMERATALKKLSGNADVVVLHIHMWDPIPTIAFATSDGPPVLLLNHADHAYWTGSSVADLILNIRPSGEALCASHRGNGRSYRLPIPIPRPDAVRGDPCGANLRAHHGIPLDAPIFLTIGSAYKYVPTPEMNFLESVRQILTQLPTSFLIAVGPKPRDPIWEELTRLTGGRAIAVGVQADLKPYFAAANAYLEGFPFGSLTALLEAVLADLPPVLAPECCPLPYRSDDFCLDSLPIAKDPAAYTAMAVKLGTRVILGATSSKDLQATAIKLHCEPEWSKNLNGLRKIIISGLKHSPISLPITEAIAKINIRYWARFSLRRQSGDNVFGYAFRRAMEESLKPHVDFELFKELNHAIRKNIQVPNPLKVWITSKLLALLPLKMSKRVYFKN